MQREKGWMHLKMVIKTSNTGLSYETWLIIWYARD